MVYCMYLRKSRADIESELRGSGETLSRHRNQLYSLAKLLNVDVVKEYAEIESGESIAGRPVVQELLKDVEKGTWAGVLVVELERLARGDTIDQGIVAQTFKYSNTLIITPAKTYHPGDEFDEEFFEFGLFMSRREYKTINRRLNNGRIASVMEGKYVGNKPPFGYLRKKLEGQKGYTLEPHPEQADVVRLIYDLYANYNKGPHLIAQELNKLGHKPQIKDKWSVNTIREILRSPLYIGRITWNRRAGVKTMKDGSLNVSRPRNYNPINVKGLHPGIVDEEVWNRAQEIIASKLTPKVNNAKVLTNPLAGLIKCGACGANMIRRPVPNQPDVLMCPVKGCKNIGSYLEYVEEDVVLAMKEWLKSYKLEISEAQPASGYTDRMERAISKAESEQEQLDVQLDNLYNLLEQGTYSVEIFTERSHKLKEQKKELQSRLDVLKTELQASASVNSKYIIPKIEEMLQVYDGLTTPELKNKILKNTIESITYTKLTKGKKSPDTQRKYSLQIRPVLPKL